MLTFLRLVIILIVVRTTYSDISHLFAPDYAVFPQYPFQVAFQQLPQTPQHQQQQQQPTLPALYGPPQPPPSPPESAGYPYPLPPPLSSTQSPVAPTQSSTEFVLPEIIENRSVKDPINFIPLQNQYLPPEDRPNYESPPKPPNHSIQQDHHGYYYPRPTSPTTQKPSAIVVIDPVDGSPPFSGYDYNVPPPPPPTPPVLARPSTPAPVYLPPPALIVSSGTIADDSAIVEHLDATNSLRLRVKDMRCLQHYPSGYFRAALKIDTFMPAIPSVDNDSNDKRCELKLSRSHVHVDISAEDFSKCGVHPCGKDLCLRLRFPAVRGLRTGADAILTLHCKSQERIATKTHAMKMSVANDLQARSIGTYAHGGVQNPLRTQIELLRYTKNGFTRHLESNGAVQLGEDLLLRAHILPGDGWNYTKLSDVSLQRISGSGELLNSARLVTANGCINPSMRSICNQPPSFDPPLGHKLNFKAIMFQGMHSGEELVLSMRITACLEERDCLSNHQQQQCSTNIGRRRRDTVDSGIPPEHSKTEVSEISRISFRVIMDDIEVSRRENTNTNSTEAPMVTLRPRVLILASSVGFVALMTCLGIIAAWKMNR